MHTKRQQVSVHFIASSSQKSYFCSPEFTKISKMANKTETKTPSLLGGTMIIAGTLIGGGMVAIPIATSGLWFYRSLLVLLYSWFCMSCSGLMLVEANLHYPKGASFDTMVSDLLGKKWNIITGLSITFVLYTLVYAYITVGGGITNTIIQSVVAPESWYQPLGGLIFCLVLASCVWISTKAIDRASTVLTLAMILGFIAMTTGLVKYINLDILADRISTGSSNSYWPYIFFAIPVCVTSFCFHGTAPSMVLYYNKDAKKIEKSILWGSLIALAIYSLWVASVQGNLARHEFGAINTAQDDVQAMLSALSTYVPVHLLKQLINFFTYVAIISSFLGASLGLFDYLADLFKIKNTKLGRLKTASITFIPPLVGSFLFPYGFVVAISYVGFAAAIWSIIVPALMVLKARKKFPNAGYRVFGGKPLVYFILLFAGITLLSLLLTQLGWIKPFLG